MKDGRLPADAGLVDCCAGIHVGPAVEQQSCGTEVAVLRGHMQERASLNGKASTTGLAAIEFGEMSVHECGLTVNLLGQIIKAATEEVEDPRRVVFGLAAGLQKDVNAGAQPLWVT